MSQAQRSPFSCAVEQDCTAGWMHLELPHGLSEIQTSWTNVGNLQLSSRPKRKNLGNARFCEAGWEINIKFGNISLNIFLLCDNFWIIQSFNTKNSGNTIAIIFLDTIDLDRNWNKERGKTQENGQKWQRGSLQAWIEVCRNHPHDAEGVWRSVSIAFFHDTHCNKNTIRMLRHRRREYFLR